ASAKSPEPSIVPCFPSAAATFSAPGWSGTRSTRAVSTGQSARVRRKSRPSETLPQRQPDASRGAGLFPDAESAEHFVEDRFDVDATDQLLETRGRRPQMNCGDDGRNGVCRP